MNSTRTIFWRPVRLSAGPGRARRRPELGLVLGLLGVDQRAARIGLHAIGVAQHEDDADGRPDDEDDQPPDDALLDRDAGEARGDAGRERVDGRAEDADAAAEQEDGRRDKSVVAGRDHDRDDQRVERQALLGHPERRAAEREDDHQDRDHQPFAARQPTDDPRDPGLDRPGLHGHPEESADDEDEQGDVDGPEQLARVPDADAAVLALDAVQAVDRRHQRVDDDPLRVRRDAVVRARDRLAVRIDVVRPGRDDPGQDRDDDDEDEQDRVGGRQAESATTLLGSGGVRGRGHAGPPSTLWVSSAAVPPAVAAGGSPVDSMCSIRNPVKP